MKTLVNMLRSNDFDYIDFNTEYSDGSVEGRLQWNIDDGTLEFGLPGGEVNLQIGQETLIRIVNDEGSTIPNGTPVYISGSTGSNFKVKISSNDNYTKARCIGVTTEEIENNQKGYVTLRGLVREIDTSAFSAGQIMWLGVDGAFTTTMPTHPVPQIAIGECLRPHADEGIMYVSPYIIPYLFNGLYVGDLEGGNYTQFENDGTIRQFGDSTTFRDEVGQLIGARIESPSSHITQNTEESSVTYDDTCTLSDYIAMSPQINHDWRSGSAIEVHVHWWQTSSNVPNWLLQYRYQTNGQAKTTAWTSLPYSSHAFTYVSGTLNQITSFGEITLPVTTSISDILQLRLIRDTNNDSTLFSGTDPLTGDVDAVSYDAHIEKNKLGSRQRYVD